MAKENNLYSKTLNRLKNNFLVVIILILFVGITGSAKLISSVEEIRNFIVGEHIRLKSVNDITFTTELTPGKLSRDYVIGKQPPYNIPTETVIWKAKIYKEQSAKPEHKLRVISEDIVIDLYIKDYKLLRLLQKLKTDTEIIFKGKLNDRPNDLDLDIDVDEVFFDL